MPPDQLVEIETLRRENAYLRGLTERAAARLFTMDFQSVSMRHELEQKRRGFRLMAELAVTLGLDADYESIFVTTSRKINATLNMQRTVVLMRDGDKGYYPAVTQGYPREEANLLQTRHLSLSHEVLDPFHPILITASDPVTWLGSFREALRLPYLISAPVYLQNEIEAVLVTGRMLEQMPYLPRLGHSDVESVQTVSAYLAAMLAGHRLKEAESLAKHDPLTHLPNLRGTTEHLHHILTLARRGGNFCAVMFIDLDGFKKVNDTLGHAAGDLVLGETAQRLKSCLRESDLVGRIGGDEFLVILAYIKRPDDASVVANKVLEKLSRPIPVHNTTASIGASIGVAIFPDHGSDEATLLRASDQAMYTVKNGGKNSYAFAQR